MICQHQKTCSGCSSLEVPVEQQRSQKVRDLKAIAPVETVPGPVFHFRDRTDLTLTEGRLGFYDKSKNIFSLNKCEIFSPDLQNFFEDFSRNLPKIKKGSLRLRTGINGERPAEGVKRGVWLDFANVDIKTLLDDGAWLRGLLEQNIEVEIGQKKKRLENTEQGLKLKDPKYNFWFSTLEGDKEVPLVCYVSSFTQPSRSWNSVMIKTLLSQLPNQEINWLEIGSGIGNFTRSLLYRGDSVTAVENDPWAIECLRENTKDFSPEVLKSDYRRLALEKKYDAILCDPPRSGLGQLAETICQNPPESLFYVSCDIDSWKRDLDAGLGKIFRAESLFLVDQFPHTPRLELLSVLRLR